MERLGIVGRSSESAELRQASLIAAESLTDPGLYINREQSWLEFNNRVLDEACDPAWPLLERVKFLSIFANNLDEFFMIRVSGLRRQLEAGVVAAPPDAMTPSEQLAAIRRDLLPMLERHSECWHDQLRPELHRAGIRVRSYDELEKKQRRLLRRYFCREVFPTLTPLAFDPGHPFPHISNLSLNLLVLLGGGAGGERVARVEIPGFLPRLLAVPSEKDAADAVSPGLVAAGRSNFVWIEDVVAANLDLLFPGLEVHASYPLRVTRDADQDIEVDEAGDLLTATQENLRLRQFGSVVRLELAESAVESVRELLAENLGLAPYLVYSLRQPIGAADLAQLVQLDRPDLKDPPFKPATSVAGGPDDDIFATIRSRDHLLYHPYDSFAPVIELIRAASEDPDVLAIKQTLYRVGTDSPVIETLVRARENGKQVAALVELKARFDEQKNIEWARTLEDAGVHVVYGVLGLKTHAKICLIARREADGIRHYLHLGTGNYNPQTARVYTDISYLTADRTLGSEAALLFNALTGYAARADENTYTRLLVAPGGMRAGLLALIEREIEAHREAGSKGHGRLVFKMNSLVDSDCIAALYRASQAGVQVDLIVRGICCLRPGVAGLSENSPGFAPSSGAFSSTHAFTTSPGEGSRGKEKALIGSADLMPRNLDHRVELLFPLDSPELISALRRNVLETQLEDTANARSLRADGVYEDLASPGEGFDTHAWMIENRHRWLEAEGEGD